jgi:TRAP-type C4-dicarboxylate transport system substrate-binding protein
MRQSSRVAFRVRERAPVAALAAALAALLVGCGGSGADKAGGQETGATAAHYEDAVKDSGALADVRSIDVTSTPDGQITFRITLGKFTSRTNAFVDLWLDTDADPETGNTTFPEAGGAEYLFSGFLGVPIPNGLSCDIRGGNACLSEFAASGWIPAPGPTARVTRTATGLTFSINRSDLGNTEELNFAAWVGGDPPERAPGGTETFNYSLALGGPRAEASPSSAGSSDKAGGTSDSGPVVLTLASHDYNPIETPDFVSAVARLSGGSVRIEVKQGYRYYDVDYEQGTIEDVRSGAVDLAVIGARAWDAAGVKSFNALVAPFLVDSHDLERRVLESPVAERMLEGVEPLGLVGIALLPGELRRPLGLTRSLVRPTDFRGARVGIRPAGIADATFDALGARAEGFPATPEGLIGFDGAESGVATIANNGYDRGARALTANVVLWPRPTTVVMNQETFDALTAEQQDALREAGREALDPSLATIEDTARASLAAICERSRLRLAIASPSDRAALRRAVQPVYDELERDSLTAELIDEIESMRSDQGTGTETLRCPGARTGTVPAALQGLWRAEVSREDLRAAGAQLEQLERAEGTWTVEIDEGNWVARNLDNGNVYRGTLAVEGDVLRQQIRSCVPANICHPGTVEEYIWSVYLGKLELARIPGRPFNLAAVAKPFTDVR